MKGIVEEVIEEKDVTVKVIAVAEDVVIVENEEVTVDVKEVIAEEEQETIDLPEEDDHLNPRKNPLEKINIQEKALLKRNDQTRREEIQVSPRKKMIRNFKGEMKI